MSPPEEAIRSCTFKWGNFKTAGKKEGVKFYDSFTYDGIEYFLHDCVYLYTEERKLPDIGKLLKIWEESGNRKRVKIIWFFRPCELGVHLKGDVQDKEIFLASGQGQGFCNVNDLEAINGKCNIVCTSKDSRNPEASTEELEMAEYIFYRTFDVGKHQICDNIEDVIAGVHVSHFFNRKGTQQLVSAPKLQVELKEKYIRADSSRLNSLKEVHGGGKDRKYGTISSPQDKPLRKQGKFHTAYERKNSVRNVSEDNKGWQCRSDVGSSGYKRKSTEDLFGEHRKKIHHGEKETKEVMVHESAQKKGIAADLQRLEISQRSVKKGIATDHQRLEISQRSVDKRNYFTKQLTWEESLEDAYRKGTVVLFDGFDPSYTSDEVEGILLEVFEKTCTAKVIPGNELSSPHSGQVLAIFKTYERAEDVINRCQTGCCMLEDGRILFASRPENPRVYEEQSKFYGHLLLDKHISRQGMEKRVAVSTSHFPQPNTIEYDMAAEWIKLETESECQLKQLYELQRQELENVRSQLRGVSDVSLVKDNLGEAAEVSLVQENSGKATEVSLVQHTQENLAEAAG